MAPNPTAFLVLAALCAVGCGGGARPDGGADVTTPPEDRPGTPDAPATPDVPARQDVTTPPNDVPVAPADGGGSAGCGRAGMPVGARAGMITVGGRERTYTIFVPAGYDPSTPHALIFGFHGLGGNGAGIRGGLGLEAASAGAAILVYPDALPRADAGGQTGWDLGRTGVDLALFDALRTDALASYCVDPSRVYAAGFSYGGWMANAVGCHRAAVVRAIAPIAGGGPQGGGCSGAVAAFVVHGTDDGAEPVASGRASRDFWRTANGCSATMVSATPAPCVAYQGCSDGHPLLWCEHGGMGGHTVPGFAQSGMWQFFSAAR